LFSTETTVRQEHLTNSLVRSCQEANSFCGSSLVRKNNWLSSPFCIHSHK